MSDKPKMKCPFCKHDGVWLVVFTDEEVSFVHCNHCQAQGPIFKHPGDDMDDEVDMKLNAIELWNESDNAIEFWNESDIDDE